MTDGIHWEALTPQTRHAFEALAALPLPVDFYLAGGTALAMQIGHRVSDDLDFYSAVNPLGEVERAVLIGQLQHLPSVVIKRESAEQLYTNIMGVEASFIFQHHPLLFPTVEVNGLRLAQPTDIGLMKLSAIKDRGTRRDFIDLYCLNDIAPFEKLFQLLPQKYFDRPDFTVHLAYALLYFKDAEADTRELRTLKRISWAAVKKYCTAGSNLLSKINAGLEPSQ
ncbi:MAG: nucleotidyl transferase AbiEii/AbiGii toxin family protein [Chloroflexi bacterium]|nr:nucleotidyl transferase AbiEii/AbiGii toxin family protein [Chloroflexota bacterium]